MTPSGHYEYQVMLNVLSNSPSVFHGFMNEVFREFLHRFVIVYMHDILIYSRNLAEHRNHVMQVLHQTQETPPLPEAWEFWVPPPHGPVHRLHPQCGWDPDGPWEGPSHPGLTPDSVSQRTSTIPRLRKFLPEVHSELRSPLRPPHFHVKSETQLSVLELRSSSYLQEAPGGLLHCSHPLTSITPTPIHSGSGCLNHQCGSSAVSMRRRASSTPPLCLLLQEAFPSGAARH